MNKSFVVSTLLLGLASWVVFDQRNRALSEEKTSNKEVTLFSYAGPFKVTPAPTLHSDLNRIRIVSVELMETSPTQAFTKITYAPHYGKIDSKSLEFRKQHEVQSISFLIPGDHTRKVKKDDILRTLFYPN